MQLGFFTMPIHPLGKDWRLSLKEDREAFILADELGFAEGYVGEHVTDAAENITSCAMFIATLVDATKRIRLGTGTVNMPNNHPAAVDIGQGILARPLQKPHPPIIVTVVAPFSKGVTEAASRGWDPISANFLMPVWVKSHWPKYVEGCERAGRPADPANWRVARSIFVADDDRTARDYVTAPDSPYRLYYNNLVAKLKAAGRTEAFKERRDMPDEAVTLEHVMDKLVIWGSPTKVTDDLLAFREQVGDFGTLLYAGKDWLDRHLGRHSMVLLAEKVLPALNAA